MNTIRWGEMKDNDSIIESSLEENKISGRQEKASELLFWASSSPGTLPVEQGICTFFFYFLSEKLMNFRKIRGERFKQMYFLPNEVLATGSRYLTKEYSTLVGSV